MEKKTIVARMTVQAGKEKEFITAAQPLINGTRAEEGNLSYNLYQSIENPASFIFYEEYQNEQAMESHAASSHFKAFGKVKEQIVCGELIIEKY